MDNALRAFANTITAYMELHYKACSMSPEEVKEMMIMLFPVVQTIAMQNAVKRIGKLPYDTKKAADEIMEYQKQVTNSEC